MIPREIALFFYPIGRDLVLANGRRSKNILTFSSLLEGFLQIVMKQKNVIIRCVTLYLIIFHSLDPLQVPLELAYFPMVLV